LEATTKNMLIGAFVTAGVDLALEAYYMYMAGQGKAPANQFPYVTPHPAIPPADDWIACAGVPFGLYALGKWMKKDNLVTMAKGGAIYGGSELAGQTMFRCIIEAQAMTGAVRYAVVGPPMIR